MGNIRSTGGGWVTNMLTGSAPDMPMTRRQAWHMIEPVRCALQRVLDGVPNDDDVGIVGMAFNHAFLRAARIERPDAAEAMNDGSRVLNELGARSCAYILAEDDAEALKVAINTWDPLLRASSLRQWAEVEDELLRIVAAMVDAGKQAA